MTLLYFCVQLIRHYQRYCTGPRVCWCKGHSPLSRGGKTGQSALPTCRLLTAGCALRIIYYLDAPHGEVPSMDPKRENGCDKPRTGRYGAHWRRLMSNSVPLLLMTMIHANYTTAQDRVALLRTPRSNLENNVLVVTEIVYLKRPLCYTKTSR